MNLEWGTKVEVVDENNKHIDFGHVMEADDKLVCVKLEKSFFLQNYPIEQIRETV